MKTSPKNAKKSPGSSMANHHKDDISHNNRNRATSAHGEENS